MCDFFSLVEVESYGILNS